MKHFDWMVIDHVDSIGLWFKGTLSGIKYVFYWNPIRTIYLVLTGKAYIGFFPLHKNHIKNM